MAKKVEGGLIALEASDFEPGGMMAADGPLAKSVRENCARSENAETSREGENWQGIIEGFCPVQGWGNVDGLNWYFRARYDAWSFDVWNVPFEEGRHLPQAEPVWSANAEWGDGGEFDASWMPYSEAWKIIEACIETGREAGWSMPSPAGGDGT
jgi:hypothetical protein